MANYDDLIERTRATRFQKGVSGNAGYQRKTQKELRELARGSVPKAFERAKQILDDDSAEWRAWMDAAKFITSYGYGSPPKTDIEAADRREDPVNQLEAEELRALARQSLADDVPEPDDDAGDDSDEAAH